MSGFWESDNGIAAAASHRRMTALHLHLPIEPPTKRARQGAKRRAAAMLQSAFDMDLVISYARGKESWPKPRAAIALDISIFGASRNPARVDTACKWLLDELNGKAYADDRQVKMLFARLWRPQEPLDSPPASGADERAPDLGPLAAAERDPKLYLTARTRASVLADLRAVRQLENRWDPFADLPTLHTTDPFEADFQRELLLDYRASFDPSDARHRQVGHQIDFHDQGQQQHYVDLVFSSLFTNLLVDRYGFWNKVRDQLVYSPYIFDFGPIPARGESSTFRRHVREVLEERRRRYPWLLPMRSISGISMVLFESPDRSKDLDNLVRETLPDIIDVLRPPNRFVPGWIAEEAELDTVATDVPFIEVAAIPADRADMPPGSLILGLSGGMRGRSWWSLAADHLDETLPWT